MTLRVYVAVRGWTPNCYVPQLQMLKPHPANGYELNPGFHYKSATYDIAVNTHGLRGPEPTASPSENHRLIATLGGSSAFGYLVSDGADAPRLLETQLRADGHDVDVLNGGVPGYNLNLTTVRYRERIAPLEPDFVILYLGWNDLPYIVSDTPDDPRFFHGEAPPAHQRLLSHSVLYGLVKSRFLGRTLRLVPPVSDAVTPTPAGAAKFRQNLAALIRAIRESGAEPIVCCQVMAAHPQVDPSLFQYLSDDAPHRAQLITLGQWLHDTLEDFAAGEDLLWIDAYEDVRPDDTILGDAIHLTQNGEQIVAELLHAKLADLPEFGTP